MGNFLRLLRIALLAWRTPRTPLLEASVVRLRVLPNDLDLNFHMNNGRYLSLMDLGRVELMFRCGLGLWLRKAWQPLVAASFCRHFKPLNLFQAYTIETRVLGWDEKWLYVEHRFLRGSDLHALGVVKALVAERKRLVPTRELLAIAGHDQFESPPLPEWVREWLRSEASAIAQLKAEPGART